MVREMKDSGIEWIGEIPEDWETLKLCYIANEIFMGNTPVYSEQVNHNYIVGQKNNQEQGIIFDGIKYGTSDFFESRRPFEFLKYGDIILNTLGTGSVGRIGYWYIKGQEQYITDGHLMIIRCKSEFDSRFVYYTLFVRRKEFEDMAVGSTNQAFLTVNKIYKIIQPIPSLKEQRCITSFLDAQCARIDAVIEQTRASIEEYKKLKQAIITRAVTKGLRPDRPMKDSGIEWIGEIPEDWSTIRIKYTSWLKGRIGWQGLTASEYVDEGPFLITGTDFNNGSINWATCAHISDARFEEDSDIHIYENDLLITKDGTIGKLAIVKNCPEKVSLNSGVLLIRNVGQNEYCVRYLYYVLLSDVFWKWYTLSQVGQSTIKHLYQAQFYDFQFVYPPLLEQQRIADFLDSKCARIDAVVEQKMNLIAELESYKKSLIFEYVTGKKEV